MAAAKSQRPYSPLEDRLFKRQQLIAPQQPNTIVTTTPVQNPEAGTVAAGSTTTPTPVATDTHTLAEMLGPSPAEREEQERRALDHKARIAGWAGLFDGLRHLGNLYYATKGATPQQLSNPYEEIERNYQAERKRLDDMQRARQSYATMLHNIKRQEKTDELAERRLARQEEETKIRRQTADARNEAYRAKANGDEARAAFYNAKADALEQGIPYDIAVKRATEAQKLAQARLANVRADNGGSSQGNYGYKIVEGYDGSGNKVKERIPTSGGGTSPQRRSGSKTNLLPQNNQQQGGSLLPKKK